MLLSARILTNVADVNNFTYADNLSFTEGDAPIVILQLIDASRDTYADGYMPQGRRYIPAIGATLEVTLGSIDSAKRVVRLATQPYAQDPSIWALQLFSTDSLRGLLDLGLKLVEGPKTTRGVARQALSIAPQQRAF